MDRSSFSHIPLFSRFRPDERDLFERHGTLREFTKGAFLFHEGDPAHSFWVVVSGLVEVIKNWGSGEEKLLTVMHPGDFIGELGVVYESHARTASARASGGPARLVEVPLVELERLLERQSNLALPMMRGAVARLLQTETAAMEDLIDRNRRLAESLAELKATQAQLIEKEKLEHELSVARKIQEAYLPREQMVLPGWDLDVHWKPAREVSGDFYDFLPLPDGRTAIVVGDVAGKGVPAALVMAVSRSVFRAAIRHGGSAGELMRQINDLLVEEMPPLMYVTAFLAIVDPRSGVVEFANAGHCIPVRYSGGASGELKVRGMPLGLMEDMAYEEGRVTLDLGEWVLFYSDALSEAHDPNRQLFGTPRLHQSARQIGRDEPAAGVLRHILRCYEEFTGQDVEQEDDLTMIVLRRAEK